MPQKSSLGFFLGLALLAATCARAQACGAIDKLSARDIEAIQALSRRSGMSGPLRLCGDYFGAPVGCPAIRVDSLPSADGNKHSWQQLYLGRGVEGQETCPWWKRGSKVYRQGGWVAARSNLENMTSWRFTHGQRHADVQLGNGISYGLADTLIRSLLDRTWQDELDVDGRQLMAQWHQQPDRLEQITSIYGNAETGYDLRFGEMGGLIVHVAVKGSVVKLVRASIYYV